MNQALAKRETETVFALVAGPPLTDLTVLGQRLAALREHANVLAPTLLGTPIPAKQAVALSVVQIDATTNKFGQGREVYFDRRFCDRDEDEVALGRVAILKILAGAGIRPIESCRTDDRKERFYVEWRVTLAGRDLSGEWVEGVATKEVDFRDGSPALQKPEKIRRGDREEKTGRMVSLDESAIADMRRNIAALAETKALLRAARNYPWLALPQKLKRSEVEKLWITPRLVPHLDPTDPQDAAVLREEALGRTRQLYRGSQGQPELTPKEQPRAQDNVIEGEIVSGPTASDVSTGGAASGGSGKTSGSDEPVVPAERRSPSAGDFDPDEGFDFEAAEIAERQAAEPAIIVCDCPCGDQTEVNASAAEVTVLRVGAVRCRDCFPGKGFDFDKHPDDMALRLPKWPQLTGLGVKRGLTPKGKK